MVLWITVQDVQITCKLNKVCAFIDFGEQKSSTLSTQHPLSVMNILQEPAHANHANPDQRGYKITIAM